MADYLEAYTKRFDLPVRTGVRVDNLAKVGDRYAVSTSDGTLQARNVAAATGGWQIPKTPAFAENLDPAIRQLHYPLRAGAGRHREGPSPPPASPPHRSARQA